MLMLAYLLLTLVSIVTLVYTFLIWNNNYWHKRNVQGPKPMPLFGSFPNLFGRRRHFADDIQEIYSQYNLTENYVGVYLMRIPQLMLLDPTQIREVFVGSFKHFLDNDISKLIDPLKDPLIACNPFLLRGEDWRKQRTLISSALTSKRIKTAYSLMQGVCDNLCIYVDSLINSTIGNGINGKDLALRFTAENLCDCVLGIKAQSFTATPLPVSQNIKLLSEENAVFLIYTAIAGIYPQVAKCFPIKFFPRACENFFRDLMLQAFKIRRTKYLKRNDFINHLLELQTQHTLSDLELASHSMTFLIDGLDTTATAIAHCLMLLAREPNCQRRLRQEIIQLNELSYEQINELPYLDSCIHESLRIFPPGFWSTKTCTEPFTFTNKNGQQFNVAIGDSVLIPIYALHHDPNFYPEPNKFKPERFMPEHGGVRKYRNLGVFLGFGNGPRMCLGVRLALVQSKAAVASIIRNFHVKLHQRTKPINGLDPKSFVAVQNGGVWLDFARV